MFLSRRYRPNIWPYYSLIAIELGFTIALLALFGIASPNTYRTKLWQDGANNGFNSSPTTGLYAAANYKPYKTPMVWSQFITDYNVVIVVLSMFLLLVKSIMYLLHVFPPIMSVALHAILLALYTVSIYYQAGHDTTDPQHPQRGPPWYITKSCSVAFSKSNIHYCTQAKAAFACTCCMEGIFFIYACLGIWSCIPSPEQKAEYLAERKARKEKWARIEADYEDAQKEAAARTREYPQTPGDQAGMNPYTPRTQAFNTLGGTTNVPRLNVTVPPSNPVRESRDLPLRNHFSTPNRPTSPPSSQQATLPAASSSSFQIRSPNLPRSPMNMPGYGVTSEGLRSPGIPSTGLRSPGLPSATGGGMRSTSFGRQQSDRQSFVSNTEEQTGGQQQQPQMYFPPPPKVSTKGKGKK